MVNLKSKEVLFVFLFALFTYLPSLSREFSTRGEPREALVVSSMISQGEYILPTVYGGNVPSKPPFLHWCGVVTSFFNSDSINARIKDFSAKIIPSEFSVRLPSALAAAIFIGFFFWFASFFVGKERAAIAAAILVTFAEWFRSAIEVRVDMVFAASLSAAMYLQFLRLESRKQLHIFYIWLTLAIAILSKGPVAVVIFGGVITLHMFFAKKMQIVPMIKELSKIILPALLPPLLWYLAAYELHPDLFTQKIVYENFSRFTSTMDDEPHKHGIFYLIGAGFLGLLPWILALVAKGWRKISRPVEPIVLFSLLQIVFITIFFCIPSSKRGVYLLPMFPAMAIVLADIMSKSSGFGWLNPSVEKKAKYALGLIILIAATFSSITLFTKIVILCGLILLLVFSTKIENKLSRVLLSLGVLIGSAVGIGAESYSKKLSPKEFSLRLSESFKNDEQTFGYLNEFYAVSFYSGKQMYRFDENNLPDKGRVVLFDNDFEALTTSLKNRGYSYNQALTSNKDAIRKGRKLRALGFEKITK